MTENYLYSQVNILTGCIGSGKSSVSIFLKELGAKVICADHLARKAVAPGSPGLKKIVRAFGSSIVDENSLNRSKLSEIVFSQPEARRLLEDITHPIIRKMSLEEFEKALLENSSIPLFYDCPLFFESELHRHNFASILVVSASRENCINRVMERDGVGKEKVIARLNSQLPIAAKVDAADYVIENDEGLAELRAKVEIVYKEIYDGLNRSVL